MAVKNKEKIKESAILFVVILLMVVSYLGLKKLAVLNRPFVDKIPESDVIYQLDSVETKGNKVELKGFYFETGKNAEYADMELILHDLTTEKNYYMKTQQGEREDVNRYFACEYDYSKSGFVATIDRSKLNLENGKYQLYVKRENDNLQAYALSTYIVNGEITGRNPILYEAFDFTGTDLENILVDARLLMCRTDIGASVYQKDGEFYWVMNSAYPYFVEGGTYIQFQMNTTQVGNLPQEQLDAGRDWSNIGFIFEENELIGSFGGYRVAKAAIPREYSVTVVWTGYHDGENWLWGEEYLFPDYRDFY